MDTDLTSVSPPPSTTSSEASHRPHLGPLDLAIASAASSASTTPTGGARCKASASEPLTPPLTPSSSFSKDGSSSGPPSTPPHDGSSPSSARWARSLFTGANPSMAKPRVGRLGRGVGGYVSSAQGSPLSERPRALSESSGTPSSAVTSDADLADMFQRGLQLDVAPEADVPCTRFLVVCPSTYVCQP